MSSNEKGSNSAFAASMPKSLVAALIFSSLSDALDEKGRGAPMDNPSSESLV